MFRQILFSTMIAGITMMSCEKDPVSTNPKVEVKHNGAFIVNEGGFNHSNGSLSFYSREDQQVQNEIFKKINNKDLGDVVQSMTIIDSLGFIVVNNSNKIEVIDMNTWLSIKSIDMPTGYSPRYLADGGNGKAYVTNLYANNVSVINLPTLEIETSIDVGANPEEITISGNKAYVANSGGGDGNTVTVIDLLSNQVVNSIQVGDNPNFIKKDTDGYLHVLCWGSWTKGSSGGIYAIDPVNDTVMDSLIIEGYSSKLCIGKEDTGYFINDGNILSFSTATYEITNDSLITGAFYGLAFDSVSEHLLALDAKDYAQNGSLMIYDLEGNLLNTYDVGIIPGNVTFVYGQN